MASGVAPRTSHQPRGTESTTGEDQQGIQLDVEVSLTSVDRIRRDLTKAVIAAKLPCIRPSISELESGELVNRCNEVGDVEINSHLFKYDADYSIARNAAAAGPTVSWTRRRDELHRDQVVKPTAAGFCGDI